MMDPATRYYCVGCGTHKFVPEPPLNPDRSIRTGCEECGFISRHKAVGVL